MRQFIIEGVYERDHGKQHYELHVNKIYHNYAINSGASTGNQKNEISAMILGGKQSMSMGLISSKHKVILFQYGINRRIRNYDIIANSEFLHEDVYTNVVDIQQYPRPESSNSRP